MNKKFAMFSVAIALLTASFIPVGSAAIAAQRKRTVKKAPSQPQTIYGQGYQKGYKDGFAQGQADWTRGEPRDFQQSQAFQRREQAFAPQFAGSEEYRQGYELGFEFGHSDAYFGRARNNTVPANAAVLAKAAALADAQRARELEQQREREQQQQAVDKQRDRREDWRNQPPREPIPEHDRTPPPVNVPGDLEMKIRLTSKIDTQNSRVGDTFTAVVVDPSTFEGATITGHISKLNRSGRITGRTELAFEFDSITFPDGRQVPFAADLQKVYESESVKKVDEEGNVETGSRTRDTQVRGGVGAAAGAILGGIAGGGKGALLGAIIGGAAGVGTVAIEGNKDLILDHGTEMLIRTARTRTR